MPRRPSFTAAELARVLKVAREAWGDRARVVINPDGAITMECRAAPTSPASPPLAPRRPTVL
ncbi:MAG: hypothetical protein ABSC25_27425 [Roseiarcus sp.]|jgi:hypothetical protein